mgnify:CR=1 FL=1|jgi:peptidoglycan/LPS O-acetylase OafA/YrhL
MFFGEKIRPNFFIRLIAFIGLISFPVYILHQEFGMIMFNMFSKNNYYLVLLITIILLVLLSSIIHIFFEKKYMTYSQKRQ